MRPVLFELGPLTVNSYGVFVALAFGAAWLVLRHELERRANRGDAAEPLVIAAALGGLVGARVYWYGEHAGDATLGDFLSASGFTWYGGVLGASLAVFVVARRVRIGLPNLLAASAPALALGYAVGRIACQTAGTARTAGRATALGDGLSRGNRAHDGAGAPDSRL